MPMETGCLKDSEWTWACSVIAGAVERDAVYRCAVVTSVVV